MVYINNNTTTIKIPKYINGNNSLVFEVTNKLTDVVLNINVTDEANQQLYYILNIEDYVAGLMSGEYTYRLKSGNNVLSTGLLIVGEYTATITEYTKTSDVIYYER